MSKEVDHFERVLQHHATRKEVTTAFYIMLEHQKRAQKATVALHEMLEQQRNAWSSATGLSQALAQQKNALSAVGGLDLLLSQHQDALAADIELGECLARYQAALADGGGLTKIIARHQLGLEVAAEFRPAITVDSEVRSGQPCLSGTRMTVYDVLEYLSGDMSDAKILDDFPDLTPADLELCRAFGTVLEARFAALAA